MNPSLLLVLAPLATFQEDPFPPAQSLDLVAAAEIHDFEGPLDPGIDDDGAWAVLLEAELSNGDKVDAIVTEGTTLILEDLATPNELGVFHSIQRASYAGGHVATEARVNPPGPGALLNVLALDHTVLHLMGDPVLDPALPAGTVWASITNLHLNRANQILVHAKLEGAAGIFGALVRIDFDDDLAITAEEVVLAEGDLPPGASAPIEFQYGAKPYFDFNDSGDWIVRVGAGLDAAIVLNGEVLVAPGDIHGPSGQTWSHLLVVALDNFGRPAFQGRLDGRHAVVFDGQIVVEQGMAIANVTGASVQEFGDPLTENYLRVSDAGTVLWYGEIGGHLWSDRGLFLNDKLITYDVTAHRSYELSSNGQYLIHRDELLLLAPEFELATGCIPNAGDLRNPGGALLGGSTLVFEMREPQDGVAATMLFAATQPFPGVPPCGLFVDGIGEILFDLTPPNPVVALAKDGLPPAIFEIPVPPALVPLFEPLMFQGAFLAPSSLDEPIRLTNGLLADIE